MRDARVYGDAWVYGFSIPMRGNETFDFGAGPLNYPLLSQFHV